MGRTPPPPGLSHRSLRWTRPSPNPPPPGTRASLPPSTGGMAEGEGRAGRGQRAAAAGVGGPHPQAGGGRPGRPARGGAQPRVQGLEPTLTPHSPLTQPPTPPPPPPRAPSTILRLAQGLDHATHALQRELAGLRDYLARLLKENDWIPQHAQCVPPAGRPSLRPGAWRSVAVTGQ